MTEENKEEYVHDIKLGKPPIELDTNQIARLASIQCSVREIASVMGVCKDVIYNNFMDAVNEGREKGKVSLRRRQWEVADEGDTRMLIHLGKHWLDQRDDKPENTEDNKPLPWDDNF
tara:strand:- start:989 stop:1339 length:351 start_codon:yes stop_codon:yes gene_type:complete